VDEEIGPPPPLGGNELRRRRTATADLVVSVLKESAVVKSFLFDAKCMGRPICRPPCRWLASTTPLKISFSIYCQTPQLAIIIDREGSLSIHHYCTHVSLVNSKVLMKLVYLEPCSVSKTNDLMKTPFSLAAEFGKRMEVLETLFQSDHLVASISDIEGSKDKAKDLMKTPFLFAAKFGKRVEVLETLFQSNQSIAFISDIEGSKDVCSV